MTTRTRSRAAGFSQATVNTVNYSYDGQCKASTTNGEHVSTVTQGSETMTDVVVPNFRRRIEAGEVINNPCTYVVGGKYESDSSTLTVTSPSMSWCQYQHKPIRDLIGPWPYAVTASISRPVDDRSVVAQGSVAKQRAIANIDSTPYAFLEDVFEFRETLRFMRRPATSLLRLAKDIARRRDRALPFGPRAVADVYLTARFAVTPLVLSLQDGAEAISKTIRSAERPKRRTSRGFDFVEYNQQGTASWGGTQFGYFQFKSQAYLNRFERIHAGILYEVSNPTVDYPFFLGVRLKDVPAGLWAVSPWSWLIDRVLDISSAVQGLTNLSDPSVAILAAWETTRTSSVSGVEVLECRPKTASWKIKGFTPSKWSKTNFTYQRLPWSPSYIDTLPTPNLKGLVDDATKIADILALAAQYLSPSSRR